MWWWQSCYCVMEIANEHSLDILLDIPNPKLTEDEEEDSVKFGKNHINYAQEEEEEYILCCWPPPTRIPPNLPIGSPPSLEVHICPLSKSKSIHHEPALTQSQTQKSAAELNFQDALSRTWCCFWWGGWRRGLRGWDHGCHGLGKMYATSASALLWECELERVH